MTYESYRMIFYIGIGAAALMLLVSVALFFLFRIPSVIGDLTGSTARKEIESIRQQNKATGHRAYTGADKKKIITSKIETRKNISRMKEENAESSSVTDDSGTLYTQETTVLQNDNYESTETTVLENRDDYGNETTALGNGDAYSNETTVLENADIYGNETALLENVDTYGNETTVLGYAQNDMYQQTGAGFEIEKDITFVHTNETID